jgi:hypothetical protein
VLYTPETDEWLRCIKILGDEQKLSITVIDGVYKYTWWNAYELKHMDRQVAAGKELDLFDELFYEGTHKNAVLGGEYDGVQIYFSSPYDWPYGDDAAEVMTTLLSEEGLIKLDPSVFAATAVSLPTPTPTPAATVTTSPSANKVLVDGKEVAFDAYNINDENYFKLRDVAFVLNGTRVQFNAALVDGAINIYKNTAYEPNGSEMQSKGAGSKEATLNKMKILIDGVETELTAYLIDGNNYFKMRELAQTFDFLPALVDGVITIDTAKPYGG